MSAFASLTLLDSSAANVVFNPSSIDSDGVATWRTGDAIFDAKKTVSMSVKTPANGSNVVRIKQRIVIPVMDTVDPSVKVGEAYATLEFVISKKATETQRLDLRKHLETLVSNAVSVAALQNLESIY